VDLELNEEASLFAESTRAFLAAKSSIKQTRATIDAPVAWDRTLWATGATLGWFSPCVDEEYGGGSVTGNPFADLAIIAEELGSVLFRGPVLPTNVVAHAVSRAGSAKQKALVLPQICSGQLVATAALEIGADALMPGVTLTERDGALELDGTVSFVPDAQLADVVLLRAHGLEGAVQVLVPLDRAGIRIDQLNGLDLARTQCTVHMTRVLLSSDDLRSGRH